MEPEHRFILFLKRKFKMALKNGLSTNIEEDLRYFKSLQDLDHAQLCLLIKSLSEYNLSLGSQLKDASDKIQKISDQMKNRLILVLHFLAIFSIIQTPNVANFIKQIVDALNG